MAEPISRNAPLLCPSAQPDWEGSVAIGVVGGTAEAPLTSHLPAPKQVTEELLALACPVTPTEVFRFAAPCLRTGCMHFQDVKCRLAERIVKTLSVVTEQLPECSIRPQSAGGSRGLHTVSTSGDGQLQSVTRDVQSGIWLKRARFDGVGSIYEEASLVDPKEIIKRAMHGSQLRKRYAAVVYGTDIDYMRFVCDLASHSDVEANATGILDRQKPNAPDLGWRSISSKKLRCSKRRSATGVSVRSTYSCVYETSIQLHLYRTGKVSGQYSFA